MEVSTSDNINALRSLKHFRPLWIIGTFILLIIGWLHFKISLDIIRAERPYIYETNYSLPSPSLIRVTTLNYRSAAADMLWIGGVQFVASNIVARRKSEAMTEYAKAVIVLDPYFYKVYSWHSAARMLAVGYPSPRDIEAANDLLEVGMQWFPNDWRLPYEATVNYIGFNKDVDIPTRIKQLKRGIKFAEAAASISGSPEVITNVSLNFREQLQRLENRQAGIQNYDGDDNSEQIDQTMLIHLYKITTNEQARDSILSRLRRINGTEALAEQLQSDAKKQKQWQKSLTQSYLPYDLLYIIQDPSTARNISNSRTEKPLNEQ